MKHMKESLKKKANMKPIYKNNPSFPKSMKKLPLKEMAYIGKT